jgi:hypothetical protein
MMWHREIPLRGIDPADLDLVAFFILLEAIGRLEDQTRDAEGLLEINLMHLQIEKAPSIRDKSVRGAKHEDVRNAGRMRGMRVGCVLCELDA